MTHIVVVAPPHKDLENVPDEAASVVNSLGGDVTLLQGKDATERGILAVIGRLLSMGKRVRGWIFLSHGNEKGIALDGEFLDTVSLAGYMSVAQSDWVIINTCGPKFLNTLQLMAPIDAVATEGDDIKDTDAWRFTRLLMLEYVRNGGNLRAAVNTVDAGSYRHRYYPGKRHESFIMNNKENPVDLVQILYDLIEGNPRRGIDTGLRQAVRELTDAQKKLTDVLNGYVLSAEREIATIRTWLIILTGAVLLLFIGLGVLWFTFIE
ncbi:hypothetical protein Rctr71_005 [Virus Rctr71]|nr:hypothetical protein Rctr71_005 [Virus Rctr71]